MYRINKVAELLSTTYLQIYCVLSADRARHPRKNLFPESEPGQARPPESFRQKQNKSQHVSSGHLEAAAVGGLEQCVRRALPSLVSSVARLRVSIKARRGVSTTEAVPHGNMSSNNNKLPNKKKRVQKPTSEERGRARMKPARPHHLLSEE